MKAVVRRGPALVQTEMAAPEPGAGQVLVKTLACGICGSDLHAVHQLEHMVETGRRSGAGSGIDPSRDLVMGHEFCAEILDYGPGSSRPFRTGTRVVSMPYVFGPDGPELVGFSTRFNGGFAEQMLLAEPLLLEAPNGLSTDMAALVEPLSVGAHAVARADLTPRSVALVVGCGPIGLAVIAALKLKGVGPIIAADFSPARRALAETLGADVIVDPSLASPHGHWSSWEVPATLSEFTGAALAGRGMRDAVIFECVGVAGMLQSLIDHAPPTAHVVVVGACMEEDRILPVIAINKQLRFTFVFAYSPDEFRQTLLDLSEGRFDASPLLTGSVGLSGVAGAFEALRDPEAHVKILVRPNQV
jgi:threonine dehydrogenase-like Zn-dependent dehydrogenase